MIPKNKINEIKALIYKYMDSIDPTGINSQFYKDMFSDMSDKQFEDMLKQKHFIKLYITKEKDDVTMKDIERASKAIGVPIFEKVDLPHIARNADGKPVKSKPCIVGYCHIRRVQQFASHKNSMSTNISRRDMKTGLLTGDDRNGKTTDRQIEVLSLYGLNKTIEEFKGPRADKMNAKNIMYNDINLTGSTKLNDIPDDPTDSIALNLVSTYMLGAGIYNNILTNDYKLPE